MTLTWGELLAVVASALWAIFVPLLSYTYLSDRRNERDAREALAKRIEDVEKDMAERISSNATTIEKVHKNTHELRDIVHVQGIKVERLEENKEHTAKALDKLEQTVRETFKELNLKLDRLLSRSGGYPSGALKDR